MNLSLELEYSSHLHPQLISKIIKNMIKRLNQLFNAKIFINQINCKYALCVSSNNNRILNFFYDLLCNVI